MSAGEDYFVVSLRGAEFVSARGGRPTAPQHNDDLQAEFLLQQSEQGEGLHEFFARQVAHRADHVELYQRAVSAGVSLVGDYQEALELIAGGSYKILNRFFPNLSIPPEEVDVLLRDDQDASDYDKDRLAVLLKWLQAHGCPPSSQEIVDELMAQREEGYAEEEIESEDGEDDSDEE